MAHGADSSDEGAAGEAGDQARPHPASVDVEADPELLRFFRASSDLFAADARPQEGATRKFDRSDVRTFLELLRDSPAAATVVAYHDFKYTAGNTLTKPLIEREYWLRLARDGLPEAQQGLAGKDGYAILHVHYAEVWDDGDSQMVYDKKRATITQINVRHTWDRGRPESERFWKKCLDLDLWRESRGSPVLGELEAPTGWKWRDHDYPEGATPWFTPYLRGLLQRGERCNKAVRKKYVECISASAAATAPEPAAASGLGQARSDSKIAETHPEPNWLALQPPDPAPWPFTILFAGVDNGHKDDPDLELQREFQMIESVYKQSKIYHDGSAPRVHIKQIFFSKLADVMIQIRREKPSVLHFGCHSEKSTGLELFRQIAKPKEIFDAIQSWNEDARR